MGKLLSKIGSVVTTALVGYEVGKESNPKIDIDNKIVQVVNNAVKDAHNHKNQGSSDYYQILLCLILAAILLAVLVAITVYSCYKKQSSAGKKAVDSYIVSMATK